MTNNIFLKKLRVLIPKGEQSNISQVMGVSEGTVRNYLNGKTDPSYKDIIALLKYKGVDEKWFAEESNNDNLELYRKTAEQTGHYSTVNSDDIEEEETIEYHGQTYVVPKIRPPHQQTGQISPKQTSKSLSSREVFKQLAAKNFDVIFDFIADEYGENSSGIEDFKDEFKVKFGKYLIWREKKRSGEDLQTDPQGNLIANDK